MTSVCDFPNCSATTDVMTPFPSCVSCMNATCPEHQIPGTLTDADVDQPETCYCKGCEAEFMASEKDQER